MQLENDLPYESIEKSFSVLKDISIEGIGLFLLSYITKHGIGYAFLSIPISMLIMGLILGLPFFFLPDDEEENEN